MMTTQNKKQLHDNSKLFKKQVKRHGGSFAVVSAKQAAMLIEGYGKKLTLDRGSCAILCSFVSADMLEIPNGIPLGINMISKRSVIFDIAKRTNYNIAVIGKSGSGKPCTIDWTEQDYLRSLQQQKVGILTKDTICLENLQLIIGNDNTPACVKQSSVEKLLDRGFVLGKNNNDWPYD